MNRWQPWIYLFFILLSILCLQKFYFFSEEKILELFRISFIGVYIWSGLHKFNAGFVQNIFPQISPIDLDFFAYIIPIVEALLGFGLFFSNTRKISVLFLLLMHLFILFLTLLGPFSHDIIVVPWNIGMIFMLFILFWNTYSLTFFKQISFLKALVMILFFVLPSLNFIGLWQNFTSFALFSGKVDKAFLYVDDEFKSNFEPSTLPYIDSNNSIYVQKYSYLELNIPFVPEKENYIHLFRVLCTKAENDLSLIMEIQTLPNILKNKWKTQSFFCDDIQNN